MENIRHYSDNFRVQDGINGIKPGLYARTRIRGGYGLHTDPKTGKSELEETVFDTHNTVLIDGVQYALEKIFELKGSLANPYLNDTDGIGSQSATTAPAGLVYPAGHAVCLFGVGMDGAASNNSTVLDVPYNTRTIPGMIPFRYTNEELTGTDAGKYYGKKLIDGTMAYMFKKFDQDPIIKHYWLDGITPNTIGTEVDSNVYTSQRKEKIQSYAEILLTIGKNDIKEWCEANGGIETAKINTLSLATGVYNAVDDDYEKIFLFSQLNIPTEPLILAKDLHIIYELFGS